MYSQIDSNKRKSWLLIALFVGLLALVGYVYGYVTDTGYGGLILALEKIRDRASAKYWIKFEAVCCPMI